MERKNSRPPCYVRSLRRTAYLCKQNQQCLFAWTSILSLPLQRVCKGLIDWLLQIMQNGRTLFLRSPRQKKICYPPAQPRNGFAWWPQHLHSWEVLHRVGSSWEEKESRLLFLSTQKVIYLKPKGVKDYLLNLPNWLQSPWRADFIIIILHDIIF